MRGGALIGCVTLVMLTACTQSGSGGNSVAATSAPPAQAEPSATVASAGATIIPVSTAGGSAGALGSCRPIGEYDGVTVHRSGSVLSFRADVDVNTDGALESYKIEDLGHFEGTRLNTRSALNTICNGVNIRAADNSLVYNYRQCGRLIEEFKRIRDFGWLRDGENYVEFYAIARVPGSERAGESKGRPCEKDGYYVSQVARPIDGSKGVCDPARWVDSLRVPAIVMPIDRKMRQAGVALHDVAAVRVPGTEKWVGAIVGDTNPSKIGEGTVALAMQLKGQSTRPANYRDVLRLKLDSADYVVFPGTAGRVPNLSNGSAAQIEETAQSLLRESGIRGSTPVCH